MLRYKIKSPTGKTLQVTEFAYEKRYKGLGWEIVDTTGKAMGSAKEISVPLPQQQGFVPPQVLALHQKLPENVAGKNDPLTDWKDPSEWASRISDTSTDPNVIRNIPIDPTGPVGVEKIILTKNDEITNLDPSVDSAPDAVTIKTAKKVGRPKKAK